MRTRRFLSVSLLVMAIVSLPGAAGGQVMVGDRVRLTVEEDISSARQAGGDEVGRESEGSRRLIGVVRSMAEGEILLWDADEGQERRVPARSVERLEISLGKKSNMLKGAAIGSAVGLFVSLFGVSSGGDDCDPSERFCEIEFLEPASTTGKVVIGTVSGGVVGLLVGALIRTERWEEAPMGASEIRLQPMPGGRWTIALRIPTTR